MEGEDSRPPDRPADPEVLLELNFVPTWARRPPGVNPYVSVEERRDIERRPPRTSRSRRVAPPAERPVRPTETQQAPPPLQVSFIPEKERLGRVVKKIHATRKAYPLLQLAELFLSNPENYLVKIELEPGADPDRKLLQCRKCGAVYLDQLTFNSHVIARHMEDLFEIVEEEGEVPEGTYTCVGRCRLSGVLLGPPNYHGFEDRVREVHRSRFPDLPLEEYRRQIEIVRDPELVEQWKQESRRVRRYRPKNREGSAELLSRTEAEARILREYAPHLVREVRKAIVRPQIIQQMADGPVKDLVREVWRRESRHPFTLVLALRPAFRHMGLHIFSIRRGEAFATPIKPEPLDPAEAVVSIREVLQFLRDHPGCTRGELLKGLRPQADPSSPEAQEILSPLRWLIDRGHVIEFFDGRLAVPTSGRQPSFSRRATRQRRDGGEYT